MFSWRIPAGNTGRLLHRRGRRNCFRAKAMAVSATKIAAAMAPAL
ncbi:hypothetical protein HMPREF3198_01618 [Winkia neuii]|nr:hypothetical protein HMPREF3198_01618 [Winkia neuii]